MNVNTTLVCTQSNYSFKKMYSTNACCVVKCKRSDWRFTITVSKIRVLKQTRHSKLQYDSDVMRGQRLYPRPESHSNDIKKKKISGPSLQTAYMSKKKIL